jgi:hypothetical protein
VARLLHAALRGKDRPSEVAGMRTRREGVCVLSGGGCVHAKYMSPSPSSFFHPLPL